MLVLFISVSGFFITQTIHFPTVKSLFNLKSDAQKKTDRAENRRHEKRVGISPPKKKSGNSDENYRQNLKKSFHSRSFFYYPFAQFRLPLFVSIPT